MKPHVHKDTIIAFANGAQIQFWHVDSARWVDTEIPEWREDRTYRVKPPAVGDLQDRVATLQGQMMALSDRYGDLNYRYLKACSERSEAVYERDRAQETLDRTILEADVRAEALTARALDAERALSLANIRNNTLADRIVRLTRQQLKNFNSEGDTP